ncbi:TPA: TIGR03987 family protein [Clostridium botulinum]|nr:TIGR03987 family protein [Clostridium botulinum]HCL4458574.1 TIGR03987 family protein [Clostridium botulinum]HCL4462486.1 TIGR03987 family protein [Clostridium botulinum]HCL4473545.1 TIGR03987 family protein [Clostridium botulinum]HCL4477135.1 TIGR03987 family protein [Clostridium botulinum]
MDEKLVFAIVTITLALAFYTAGVWSERKSNTLKKWHVITFWIGLVFDTTGTLTMDKIAKAGSTSISSDQLALHGFTGGLAIVLMLLHALWATWVLYKKDENKKVIFHKFSITVWVIWLIPYIIGMIIGIS